MKKYKASEKGIASAAKFAASEKGKALAERKYAVQKAKYNKGGTAPDLHCEGCLKGYKTKKVGNLNAHKKRCPAHKKD